MAMPLKEGTVTYPKAPYENLKIDTNWLENYQTNMTATTYTPIFYNESITSATTAIDGTSTRLYFSDTDSKKIKENVESMLKIELRNTIQEEIKKLVGDIDTLKSEKEKLVEDIKCLQMHYQSVKKELIDDIDLLESSIKQRMESIARFALLQI